MDATIHAETETAVELTVTDNDGIDHDLELARDGVVRTHRTGGTTADSPDRVPERQVRRFARYYVYRKRGYETIDPYGERSWGTYPERVAATAFLVAIMAPETVESQFEAAYRQRMPPADAGPIEPPATGPETTCERIEQDVYLSLHDGILRRFFDVLIEIEALGAVRTLLDRYPQKDDGPLFERLGNILSSPSGPTDDERLATDRFAIPSSFIRGTSPLRVHWRTDGPKRVQYGSGDTPSGVPIACRLQLPVTDSPVRSPAAFQRLLVDHLCCQLRDCYVGMGLAPPRDLRVRGSGIAAATVAYKQRDRYQRYDDPDAIIDWTRLAPAPSFDSNN